VHALIRASRLHGAVKPFTLPAMLHRHARPPLQDVRASRAAFAFYAFYPVAPPGRARG
jgi:hypothetical protein